MQYMGREYRANGGGVSATALQLIACPCLRVTTSQHRHVRRVFGSWDSRCHNIYCCDAIYIGVPLASDLAATWCVVLRGRVCWNLVSERHDVVWCDHRSLPARVCICVLQM